MVKEGGKIMLTQNGKPSLAMILAGLLAAYVASPVDMLPGPVDDGAFVAVGLPILMLLFAINGLRKGKGQ